MPRFQDDNQMKRLKDLRESEEEALISLLARERYGIPYIDLSGESIDNDAIRALTEEQAREFEVGPYKLIGKKLSLAVRSPENLNAQKAIQILKNKGYIITLVMASQKSIEKVHERYKDLSFAKASRSGGIEISAITLEELSHTTKTIEDAVNSINSAVNELGEYKLSILLEIIIGTAMGLGASDIHIEPMEDKTELRFRLDGVLRIITHFNKATYKQINTRIKLLSGLKLTITSNPQDGRFSAYFKPQDKELEINFRTSMVPGAYGESIVLRILNPEAIQVELEQLGISEPLYEIFVKEISKPNGLILLTGPTGSGKTTTLYAFLKKIYSSEKKIITIEDPIEYHLPGITQTQADHKKGYNFLEGLRSALRQDPDVIMVGEIRDPETAKTAVESALTGHIVFSTLHTNNASGVIPRLIDLDVNPKILGSALTLSIAQRLVRKICSQCKYERPITPEEREHIDRIWNNAKEKDKDIEKFGANKDIQNLWSADGCPHCNGTGYKGRIGIFEAIQTTEDIENSIIENPSEREIKKIADKQKTLDMKEDALIKILQGVTDFEEVKDVVDLYEKN